MDTMLSNMSAALSVLLVICGSIPGIAGNVYGTGTLWSANNCNPAGLNGAVQGTVTDAICCNTNYDTYQGVTKVYKCDNFNKVACNGEDTCRWKVNEEWTQSSGEAMGKCAMNRDSKNNVCCQAANMNKVRNCMDLMAMRCPKPWQISPECCPAVDNKHWNILKTEEGKVCCNSPCTAIEMAWSGHEGNATAGIPPSPGKPECSAMLSENCAPGKRGYMQQMMGGHGGLGGMGMDPNMLSQLMGMPVSKPMDIGQVIPGMGGSTGMNGGLTLAALNGMGFGSSKDSHVDEITVDDFFDAIIDGLDNDKDVFEYNKEINSDSWFGKQSFGGHVDGFKFINPMKFINRIYGSPFGLSNAQAMYGMQYGIPQSKFKQSGQHQRMTGFANPYGPTPQYGAQYGPQYGPPAPPAPPVYAPPVYNPHGPPSPLPPVAEPHPEPQPEPHAEPQPHYAQPYPEPQPHYAQPYPEPQPHYAQPYPEPQPHYAQPYPEPQPHYAQPYSEPQPVYQPYYAQPYPEPQQQHYAQPYPEPQPHYAPPQPEPHPEPYPEPEAAYQPHYAQQYPEPHPEPAYQPQYVQPYPEPQPHYAQPYQEPYYSQPQPEPWYAQSQPQHSNYYQAPAYPAHPPQPSYGAPPAYQAQAPPAAFLEPAPAGADPTVDENTN